MRQIPTTQEQAVKEIYGFTQKHLHYGKNNKEIVVQAILEHWKYGTLDFLYDTNGLIYAMRYNVSHDGRTALVLDLAVRRDKRNFKLLKFIIARNWSRWPTLTEFKFERENKYPDRDFRYYKLSKLFKKRE